MIIVISFCIKNSIHSHHFHYKGYFLGYKISEIEVRRSDFEFQVREEYLLKLKVVEVVGANLMCELIDYKKLEGLSLI
jgi:hypothetical protein